MSEPRISEAKRIVVKVGSSLVTNRGEGLDLAAMQNWARQIATLRVAGKEIVLVSSGAIAEGMQRLGWKKRPHAMHELQAAAAVGQMGLVEAYEGCFRSHAIRTAQVLLTHADLADRSRYLNARSTLRTLLDLGVVAVINENDTVVTDEIRFGDNDTLASLVTNLIEADALVILTDTGGLYSADPRRDAAATLIGEARAGDPASRADRRRYGKRNRPRRHAHEGARGEACRPQRRAHRDRLRCTSPSVLVRLVAGEAIGTLLRADTAPLAARKQWLADHVQVSGRLLLDAGAVRALAAGGKSLLPIGVKKVDGDFERGAVVACVGDDGRELARGLVNYSAMESRRILGRPSSDIEALLGYVDEPELIHRDNLVLL